MTKAGQRRRVSRGSVYSCLAVLVCIGALSNACNDDDDNSGAAGKGGSAGTAGKGGSAGTAGAGGAAGNPNDASADTGGNDAGQASLKINEASRVSSPFDATPDPDGRVVYMTALDATGAAGVFKVPVSGASEGGTASAVFSGAPLVAPFSIATSTDGSNLYVADPAWESDDGAQSGQVFTMPANGGPPSGVPGTAGMMPRSLEIVRENGVDQIVFSGRAEDGTPGVFKVSAAGGAASAMSSAGSLMDPSGIAVSSAGSIYVADTRASGARQASILLLQAGGAPQVLAELPVGYPVGLALTKDERSLLVSGLDEATLTDVLYTIDLSSKAVQKFAGDPNTDLSQFTEAAGLHRAKNSDVFAWADSRANGTGTVFFITRQ